jgi:hypothetical protein
VAWRGIARSRCPESLRIDAGAASGHISIGRLLRTFFIFPPALTWLYQQRRASAVRASDDQGQAVLPAATPALHRHVIATLLRAAFIKDSAASDLLRQRSL